MVERHEIIDIKAWDADVSTGYSLTPYKTLDVSSRADLSVDTLTLVLADSHPAMELLRAHRRIPVPVTFGLNGEEWSGLVTSLKQTKDGEVTLTASGDTKHAHRALARARSSSAIDGDVAQVEAPIGELTAKIIGEAAQRTGLPVYILKEHDGDVAQAEIGSEDTIADVLNPHLEASDTFVSMRLLRPGQELPGAGDVLRVQGQLEQDWEQSRLTAGAWPQAAESPRLKRASVIPPVTPMPRLSWAGWATQDATGGSIARSQGVCWMPFDIGQHDRGYWQEEQSEGVRVATAEELSAARRAGWGEHVTVWSAGRFSAAVNRSAVDAAARAGLLVRTSGAKIATAAAALSYIGSGAAYAWFNGTSWVLANAADFAAEDERRNPVITQKQTPAILVHIHAGRDRRDHVLFSASEGGGLEDWATTTNSPEAAMIHMTTQLSQATLEALKSGTATTDPVAGLLTPGEASQFVGELPDIVNSVDVNASPFSTVSGTDIAQHHLGGSVNMNAAGAFFYREMSTSAGGAGTNPVGEIGRAYADAQGSTSIELTPGFSASTVFGNDVKVEGRVIPGWKPGDRVSFTEGITRISEVISGYELHSAWDEPLRVTPILARADNGILDTLTERLRRAESNAAKALLQNPRRVPKDDVDTVVDGNETVKDAKDKADSAIDAVNDADGLIQGSVKSAREYSEESLVHSKASREHSASSLLHSQESFGHAEDAANAAAIAGQHSDKSLEHSAASQQSSADSHAYSELSRLHSQTSQQLAATSAAQSALSVQYSEESHEWSELSHEHSQASAAHSDKSLEHSEVAQGHSEEAQGFSQAAHDSSVASHESSELSHSYSETSREHSEVAQGYSEQSHGYSQAAQGYSEEAAGHSADSLTHSNTAKGHSDTASGHSATAKKHSDTASGYSKTAAGHSATAKGHSEDAAGHSQAASQASSQSQTWATTAKGHSNSAAGHSATAKGHSDKAFNYSESSKTFSQAAATASSKAEAASQTVQNLQPQIQGLVDEAAAASSESSQHSAAAKGYSETSSEHSQAATAAKELSLDALRDAERARDAAETSRRDAESKRDEAEQARKAGFAAMSAASAAMAMAEQARAEAEQERAMAEQARALAEGDRQAAETARSAAETARSNAETARSRAETARGQAEGFRDDAEKKRAAAETARSKADTARKAAETARDAAETSRSNAESERSKAEAARTRAETARTAAETARSAADTARSKAETARDQAELRRASAETERKNAELARDKAEGYRDAAEGFRDEAEQKRAAAETARKAAETSRSKAETERKNAEAARDKAEGYRNEAEQKRAAAETARAAAATARSGAETARNKAEGYRDDAEKKRAAAEGERALAEGYRKRAFNSMVAASHSMSMAERSRSAAETERAAAEASRALAESERSKAETARQNAEKARQETIDTFKATQEEIDGMQDDAIAALESQAAEIAELQNRSMNIAMVDSVGSTHPDVTVSKDVGASSYLATVRNISSGTKIQADFYTKATNGSLSYVSSQQYVSTSTSRGVSVSSGNRVVNIMWARPNAQQVPISLSSSGASPSQKTWTDVPGLSRKAGGRVTNGQLTIRATWEAANRGSTYGIRVLVGTTVFKSYTTTTLGPLSFLGSGDSRYTVSVSNLKMNKGQTFKVQVYSSAGTALQRSVKSATAVGSWIEHAS